MSRLLFGQDDRADSMFRALVAGYLAPTWVKRANAMKVCGTAGVKLRCECGCAQLVPYRCGSRACPSCARILAAQKTAKVANRVAVASESRWTGDLWDGQGKPRKIGWKLFTGTSRASLPSRRYDADVLTERIRRVRGAWGPFWRATPWGRRVRLPRVDGETGEVLGYNRRARRDTAAIMGLEVAPGGMVHLHAAIRGEWVDADELGRLWSTALGERAFVKIRAIRATTPGDFEKALREVLKYVTKWDKQPGSREQRAAAIEAAMRGVRRIELAGAIRAMPGVDALVERPDPEACSQCGSTGAWSWSGIWEPERVQGNGGFGRVIATYDDAERRAFRRNPLGAVTERARDRADGILADIASGNVHDAFASPAAETDFSAPFTEV